MIPARSLRSMQEDFNLVRRCADMITKAGEGLVIFASLLRLRDRSFLSVANLINSERE